MDRQQTSDHGSSPAGPAAGPPTGGAAGRGSSASVRAANAAAGGIIRAGAVAVLAAMLGICVFLFQSAWPLLTSGRVESVEPLGPADAGRVADDEARAAPVLGLIRGGLVMTLRADGRLILDDPELSWRGAADPLGGPVEIAAAHSDPSADIVTLVTADGRITQGRIASAVAPLRASRLPERLRDMTPGTRLDEFRPEDARAIETAARASGLEGEVVLVWREPEADDSPPGRAGDGGGWWARTVAADLPDPVAVEALTNPVRSVVAARVDASRRVAVVQTRGGDAIEIGLSERRSFVGAARLEASARALAIPEAGAREPPRWLVPLPAGESHLAVWPDGTALRFRPGDNAVIERTDLTPAEPGTPAGTVTDAALALGGRTLLLGRGDGTAEAWLLAAPDPEALQPDRARGGNAAPGNADRLVRAHRARLGSAAITAIEPAPQGRTAAFGFADGALALWNATSEKLVARVPGEGRGPVRVAARAPDLRSAAAWHESGAAAVARLDPAHPGASWVSLFAPVHYESYDEPTFVYQAEGSAGAEPKFSLVPLIWGTLKATAVSMLIAVPLAVLAALYTSEFMHPNARRVIKPAIELMASLPSVVLGFIAVAVVAPWVRDQLPAVIVWPLAAPVAVVLGAQAWRGVPARLSRRVRTVTRLALIAIAALAGTAAALAIGPRVESLLFAGAEGPGSFRVWLDQDPTAAGESWRDGAWPGWLLALLIPAAIAAVAVEGRLLGAWWSARHAGEGGSAALHGLARSLWHLVLTLGLAGGAGLALTALGADPRETVFGSGSPPNFFQRNTLVVGIVMGFAVIPIIYTISEDAMRAVPEGLRAASLGCGATPWQTATRVVLPVAGSGVFSACMVGLGRAVGETMIVLMATGNTPLMEWNLFSGVRTLAANIAVELPEAARGGTHYRVLFLCGLVLFLMTLLVNTTAEIVRQRFRKRSAAL